MKSTFSLFVALALSLGLADTSMADTPALSPAARAALQRVLDRGKATHSDAILVLHDGEVIGSYYRDGKPPGPIELMSATKSVVALGIGQLLAAGKIKSLDEPVYDFYPEWKQGLKADITVRMLLNHTSGIQNVRLAGKEIYPAPDAIQLALAADLVTRPGQRFVYNNKAVNLLAGIIAKASGMPMDVFFRNGLFKAMDIHPGPWGKDEAGHPYAMAGLKLTAADAAKIGRLVLEHGKWHGRQLVPARYIETMLAPGQSSVPICGLLWWRQPAWTHFFPNPEIFARLRDLGVPESTVKRLLPLGDASFDSGTKAVSAVIKALGPHGSRILHTQLTPLGIGPYNLFRIKQGPVVAYMAKGYLGQYIVVIPKAHLVAVRQIDDSHARPGQDDYKDFTQRLIALARAMGDLPPEPPMPGG